MAGLARTDQAGWGEGFPDMVADLLGTTPPAPGNQATQGNKGK
jgi:cytochrome c biogenesis protein